MKRAGRIHIITMKTLFNIYWKDLQNCNQNFFYVHHKNKQNHNQHFELLFFILHLHYGTSKKLSSCRKINLLLVINICFLFSSLEIQIKLIETEEGSNFLTLSEKELLTNLQKYTSYQKYFMQRVCYWYNLMSCIPFDNWKA